MATEQTAQKVVREKGQTTCVYHRGQSLILYCETCSDVMCLKCLSGLHKGHFVCDLNEVIPSMKTELQTYLNKNNRAQIQKGIDSTENEMKKNLNNFDSLCSEVKAQSVKLKQAIDIKTEKVLEFCKQMEEGNIKALTNYKRELQSQIRGFDDNLQQDYTKVLTDGSMLQVHDTLKEVRSKTNVPLMPIMSTASFLPNKNPHSYMDRYFGTITSSAFRPLQYTFLPKIIELSTFDLDSPLALTAICASTKCEAWVCQSNNYSSVLNLLDTNGDVQQTVPWELPIYDASVSPTTKNLWVCSDQSVYELDVSLKSSESLLKTIPTIRGNNISCLCVTIDDQVIVGDAFKITKYTKDGRAVITTQARQSGSSLVPVPGKITECCVTRNIAVISTNRFVVVMDQDFEKLFEHSVVIAENIRKELNIEQSQNMYDLQYDTVGNLIICCDSYLHILSGRGEFLKAIEMQPLLQKNCFRKVSLDTDGVLWTGWTIYDTDTVNAYKKYQNGVKRLQYCKQNGV